MTPFSPDIEHAALVQSLDPLVVTALVEQESAYNPWAWNPEPRYRYFWNVDTQAPFRPVTGSELVAKFPPQGFPSLLGDDDQEWWGQQASWGLAQIMGAVAREHGFRGPYLTELCDPAVNLRLACLHLAGLERWARKLYVGLSGRAETTIRRSMLAAYNGGQSGNAPNSGGMRNGDYADRVLARYARLKG